jgi:hypothetical protein
MTKRISLAAIIVVALVLTITTYAFAASNTMPTASNAGDGSVAISGYTITNVRYTLGASDPTTITSVAFTITPDGGGTAPNTTKVQLVSGGSWYDCSVTGTSATCNLTTAVSVTSANHLGIVAAD